MVHHMVHCRTIFLKKSNIFKDYMVNPSPLLAPDFPIFQTSTLSDKFIVAVLLWFPVPRGIINGLRTAIFSFRAGVSPVVARIESFIVVDRFRAI